MLPPESRIKDSLAAWAIKLRKDQRTVRRYAQSGILPDAYQTAGGQWRAPFTPKALIEVHARLNRFARNRSYDGFNKLVKLYPEARNYTIAYAILLALRRVRLDGELRVLRTEQRFLGLLDSKEGRDRLRAAQKRFPPWASALRVVKDKGWKKAALIAACAHAHDELRANSKAESAAMFDAGRFRPFGVSPKGEILVTDRRPRVFSVIQKWQWILARTPIVSAPIIAEANASYPEGFHRKPQKLLTARTFYNWYSPAEIAFGIRTAESLLA